MSGINPLFESQHEWKGRDSESGIVEAVRSSYLSSEERKRRRISFLYAVNFILFIWVHVLTVKSVITAIYHYC